MTIFIICGARPNFMKIAPITRAFKKYHINYKIVHTGQHYDYKMSKIFFEEFDLHKPDFYLNIGSGTHGKQTGLIMIKLEELLIKEKPNMIFTVGDVNSTLAAAIVASKLHIPLAHQEAGARSFDRKMPEEINRVITDVLSDILFPKAEDDILNLTSEGISKEKIHLVGDVMIDNLFYNLKKLPLKIKQKPYCLVTIHRPSNTDNIKQLKEILLALIQLSKKIKIIFPIHPRTKLQIMSKTNMMPLLKNNIEMLEPQGFIKFLDLLRNAQIILTDSGGIQIETSILNIPCITLRDSTEVPHTVSYGSNTLLGKNTTSNQIIKKTLYLIEHPKVTNFPQKMQNIMDGKSSERIAKIIKKYIKDNNE